MRVPTVVPLALLTLTLGSPLPAQGPGQRPGSISFTPPRMVSGYELKNQHMLGPGAGVQLRYERAGDGWIDVYVYPTPRDSSCTGGCDTLAVKRETDEFASLIPEMLRRGYYQRLSIAADEHVAFTAVGGGHARHLRLEGVDEGRKVTSQFYLFPAGNVLLKVRATYAPSSATDSAVQAFAQTFVEEGFSGGQTCANGPPHGETIGMSGEAALAPEQLRVRVDSVLRVLGYQWDAGGGELKSWQTRPVRSWPDRPEWAMMRNKPHPGMVLRFTIEPQQRGSKLTVFADLQCGMADEATEGAFALIATMEVMSIFSKDRR